jgi:hypothetical protein
VVVMEDTEIRCEYDERDWKKRGGCAVTHGGRISRQEFKQKTYDLCKQGHGDMGKKKGLEQSLLPMCQMDGKHNAQM